MSHIAIMWRAVGPIFLGHPFLTAGRLWFIAGLRLMAAFAVAGAVFTLTVLVTVELWPFEGPRAVLVYGVGLAIATWLGISAGTLAARPSQQSLVANCLAGAAMLVPILLAVQGGISGRSVSGYLVYLLGTGIGGLAAIRLLSLLGREHAVST